MEEDSRICEPGPSQGFSTDRNRVPIPATQDIPPSRPIDEEGETEYGVRRSISCSQLAAWNSQLCEKNYVICPVNNCGLMFHGVPQIQNHYVNCTGRCNSAMLKCSRCHAVVAVDHLYHHMKAMHQLEPSRHPSSDSSSSEVARATGAIEGNRSSQKAGKPLLPSSAASSGATAVVSEDEDGRDFHRYSTLGTSKLCPPSKLHHVHEQLEVRWKQDIITTGCATCPVEGCISSFQLSMVFVLHFQQCCRGFKPQEL
ncbi:uncharacterized protein [Procambarus clarkii]|uniref:uncharacterized protein n=1 Tax=Procambarus clarkii TaxID=6728 RepID=UPI003742E939